MKLPCVRFGRVALAAALLALAACERRDPAQATSPAAAGASAANSTITPQPGDLPASSQSAAGPSDGATAIGGMVTNQGTGKAGAGNAPAPTGGDGAASAPGTAASK